MRCSTLCILCNEASETDCNDQNLERPKMVNQHSHVERADLAPSPGINSLINAANRGDRFKLLEDDTVLHTNLTNPVHPVFRQLENENKLQLALQLASQFLLHDRLLEFFVPLLFGREMHDVRSKKTYLYDPLVHEPKAKQTQLLSAVREALQCLADRLEICFVNHKKQRLYARTIANGMTSAPQASCCRAFQRKVSPKIELTDKFLQYYRDANGYANASRCAQYRHDFLFASTLVHEVVHAVGVMRRGNLLEPHYRQDYPETEWGYAWENFMFGSIFNPQDMTKPGTHLLMRKVWADNKVADANGGKEYCDVPMSWVAQWFRNETWTLIAEQGPTSIDAPTTHFKIQVSHKLGAWVVTSYRPDVRKDIADLYERWQKHSRHHLSIEGSSLDGQQVSQKIYYNTRSQAELQKSNVPVPSRMRNQAPKSSLIQKLLSSSKPDRNAGKQPPFVNQPHLTTHPHVVAVCRTTSPCRIRKRRVDADDDAGGSQVLEVTKRLRTAS